MSEYLFVAASEEELNNLVEGKAPEASMGWNGHGSTIRMPHGITGVIWKEPHNSRDVVRPIILVSHTADLKRLFGRFAQLRGDLSPLSTWCHVVAPSRLESMEWFTREAELSGFETAWTGLIVAEALLLANLPISKIKLPACLATQSFSIARTKAMWSSIRTGDVLDRYDKTQALLRSGEQRAIRLRPALEDIWSALSVVSVDEGISSNAELRPIVEALRALNRARQTGDLEEAGRFAEPLSHIAPEASLFSRMSSLTPEQRVKEFDQILSALTQLPNAGASLYRQVLAMLAGYLATVAAGGSPSLALVEDSARKLPEVTAWAYVLGSVGERVSWTSSFDGLGRLVARELGRPLRLDEAPNCDFSLDEAESLYDPHLSDPLVHLRLKQSRIATVALFSGVNISVSLSDKTQDVAASAPNERYPDSNKIRPASNDDPWKLIADAVWPYLRGRLSAPPQNDRTYDPNFRNYAKSGQAKDHRARPSCH